MSNRIPIVAQQIKQIISEIVFKQVKDPRVGFVTVSRVKLSNDLREALVFISVLGTEKQKQDTMKALKRATGFIQYNLGREMSLKFTPHIKFKYDSSLDHAFHIDEVIKEIKKGEI